MQGGMKSAKNLVKLVIFGVIGIGGLVVVAIVARGLVFNGRVAPIFNTIPIPDLLSGLP